MSTPENEQVKDPCEYMAHLAQEILPLKKVGFNESYRSTKSGDLIYDSKWCRVNFVWSGWDMYGGNTISIYYGRLHAPNDKSTMIWNKEECQCWHRVELMLHFLDRDKPEHASKMIYTHSLIEQYKNSALGQNLTGNRRQPEWLVRMHAMIWDRYTPRLFETLDLQHPDIWEQYRRFLKEVYDIRGRNPDIEPSPDKVC